MKLVNNNNNFIKCSRVTYMERRVGAQQRSEHNIQVSAFMYNDTKYVYGWWDAVLCWEVESIKNGSMQRVGGERYRKGLKMI